MRGAWLIVVALGCGGGKDDGGGTTSDKPTDKPADQAAAPASPAIDAVVAAWKKGGLSPSAMAPIKAFGKTCQGGSVKDVDVVICEHGGQSTTAEKAGLDWVGEAPSGSAWTSGAVVIAAADRKKADKDGKTINQLMKLAPK